MSEVYTVGCFISFIAVIFLVCFILGGLNE